MAKEPLLSSRGVHLDRPSTMLGFADGGYAEQTRITSSSKTRGSFSFSRRARLIRNPDLVTLTEILSGVNILRCRHPMALVTQAEYARIRGVSKVAIHKAVKRGRIMLTVVPGRRALVDVDAANLSWAYRTDVDQQIRGCPSQVANTHTLAHQSASRQAPERADNGAFTAGRYNYSALLEEKTRFARLRVIEMEICLTQMRSELVSTSTMEAEWSSRVAIALEAFLRVAKEIAHVIALEYRPEVIHELLKQQIMQTMVTLSQSPGPRPSPK